MKERPILFGDELVRAILDGRKTETRRPMVIGRACATGGTLHQTWLPIGRGLCIGLRDNGTWPNTVLQHCPFGVVGDRLWVRECFAPNHGPASTGPEHCLFRADDNRSIEDLSEARWTPSIHMPRWASRLALEITHVKVERLQALTQDGARAEGFVHDARGTAQQHFEYTWDAIYGGIDKKTQKPRSFGWTQNPWVWVVQFRRLP